jgi:hypothetical protein
MIKNNYKAVLVYTGYNENSIEKVELVEASDMHVVMNLLLERDRQVNAECFEEFQEFEQYMTDFFGHGTIINGVGVSEAGEENSWIVLPEGHKFYDLLSIDCEEWSTEQWDQWLEFTDKVTQE